MRTPQLSDSYDVVVAGGGVMGSWAAAQAAARGASCLLMDQFEPGHRLGSSHGDGRIYRFAYLEDLYMDMMGFSYKRWLELQEFAGHPLMAQTGGISINHVAARGTDGDALSRLEALYRDRGFEHELLDAGSCRERFPQFSLPAGVEALYLARMGVLFATKCVQATWRYAQCMGAALQTHLELKSLRSDGDGVILTLMGDGGDQGIRARRLVLAPGSWLSGLADSLLGIRIPTRVSAETVSYFAPRDDCAVDHTYERMPVFLSYIDNSLGPFGTYGLPQIDVPGVKISAHFVGPTVDPVRRPLSSGGALRGIASEEAEAAAGSRIAAVMEENRRCANKLFAHLEPEPFESQSCLYTITPDHDYVIDTVPHMPAVILAGGGSGHAFKMGPAIGEACACLALGEEPPFPLRQFGIKRLQGTPSSDASAMRK